MKRVGIVLDGITGAVPVACGMLAAVSALPTAFGIEVAFAPLIVFCAVAALLLSFWMCVPRYGFGFGAIFLAGVLLIVAFRLKSIGDGAVVVFTKSLEMLLEGIPDQLASSGLPERCAAVVRPDLCAAYFLMIIAAGAGLLMAFSLLHCKMITMSILIPMPLVLLSFIFTDEQPAIWAIILLTVYWGCAIVGNGVRRGESDRAGLFFAILAPSLLILSLLIMAVLPDPKSFSGIPEGTRQKIFSDVFGDIGDSVLSWFGNDSPREIDLDTVKNHDSGTQILFSVRASSAGTYHLRVHSYGAYGNGKWLPAEPYEGEWRSMEALGNRQTAAYDRLSVRGSFSKERIVPYAFTESRVTPDESFVRSKGAAEYSWTFAREYVIAPEQAAAAERDYYRFALEHYTMPAGSEKDALRALVRGVIRAPSDPAADVGATYETARRVAEFVRSGREYTPTPPDAPNGQDFILFFLAEGRQGYCVHFASATTAILQALDIPARYTTGYYVPDVTGEWQSVAEDAKHAWAEVYLYGVGWVPIESTPHFEDSSPAIVPSSHEVGMEPDPSAAPVTVPPLPIPSLLPGPDIGGVPQSTPGPGGATVYVPQTAAPSAPVSTPRSTAPAREEQRNAAAPSEKTEPQSRAWLLLLLIPVLWLGVGMLIRVHREASFRDPNVRRSIPEMAYYLKRLERFGLEKDPDAEHWALEAAFSDHAMREELQTLRKRVRAAQTAFRRKRPFLQFVLRWVLFLV